MTSRPTAARRAAAAALVVSVSVALAACTSDGGSADSSGSGSGGASSTLPSLAVPTPSGSSTASRSTAAPSSSVRTTTAPTGPQRSQVTRAPVSLSATATFGGGVTGTITGVRALQAKAVAPGEVGGPGLAVGIRIVNDSDRRIDLGNAVVDLAYGADRAPGAPLSGPPSAPLPASLAAGKSARGTFLFRVNSNRGGQPLVISVSYAATAPRVVFTGTS